jgi:hypothetical protein
LLQNELNDGVYFLRNKSGKNQMIVVGNWFL